jgi:type IV secretory pathway TrbF-like protein
VTKTMARTSIPENPYLAARQEWNERYGSYVKAAAAWRIVGVTGMLMAVIGFSYALYQSTQVKLVPYIVEVDKLGTTATTGFPAADRVCGPTRGARDVGKFRIELPLGDARHRRPEAVHRPGICTSQVVRPGDRKGQCLVPEQLTV